ncbi:MAG TPA: hypothetical protein PKM35_04935 [Holophaga sp.]|nr:hypothetical protein [Holophaga sp.]
MLRINRLAMQGSGQGSGGAENEERKISVFCIYPFHSFHPCFIDFLHFPLASGDSGSQVSSRGLAADEKQISTRIKEMKGIKKKGN